MSADEKELGVVPSGRDARSDEHSTLGLPWRPESGDAIAATTGLGTFVCMAPTDWDRSMKHWRERRDFIVLSANAHHGLVEALRTAIKFVDKASGTALGIYPDPDGVLTRLADEGMGLSASLNAKLTEI